jgi:cytochrome c peroxidase
MKKIIFLFIASLIFLMACQKEQELITCQTEEKILVIPEGFPEPIFPTDNEFTKARWDLGKKLFFDPVLSRDSSISCASCHFSEKAFSDTVAFSLGVDQAIGTRNAPTLANLAYHPYFTREGGIPTLEMQILVPIQEHNEFDFNIVLIVEKLQKDSTYQKMSRVAYHRGEMDAFVLTRAISTFERSLLSGNSRYDEFFFQNKNNALAEAEIRGMDLFFGEKTGCSNCHNDFNFTNYAFENNGLYKNYPDPGRFRLTGEVSDSAKFKVPTLRNIELTAPYMHDGSIETLEEIIMHYESGGKNHPNKSEMIEPFVLTETERDDLVLFLKTLTDESFINNPLFKE